MLAAGTGAVLTPSSSQRARARFACLGASADIPTGVLAPRPLHSWAMGFLDFPHRVPLH